MNTFFSKSDSFSLKLLKIILAACLATPILAWSGVIFPYTVPKVFAFRILVELAAVFYLYLILKYPAIFFTPLFKGGLGGFCHSGRPSVIPARFDEANARRAQSLSSTRSGTGIQSNQKNYGSTITAPSVIPVKTGIQAPGSRIKCGMTIGAVVLVFLVVSFLSALFGADFYSSFWGNLERGGGLFGLLHFVAFFFMLVSVFRMDSPSSFFGGLLTSVIPPPSVIPAKAGIQAFGSRSKFVHRIAGRGFKNQDFSHQLIIVSVFTSTLISLLAIFQHFFNLGILLPQVDRVYSLIGNPGVLSSYLIFNIFLAGYLAILSFKKSNFCHWDLPASTRKDSLSTRGGGFCWKFARLAGAVAKRVISHLDSFGYCLLFLVSCLALALTGTRGAWLGLLAGIIVFLVLILFDPPFLKARFDLSKTRRGGREGFKRFKKLSLSFLVAIVILLGSLFFFHNSSFVKNNPTLSRLASISLSDSTTQSRLILWQGAWQTWQSRPLLGFGSENFETAISKYLSPQLANFEAYSTDRAHNFIFDYGVTLGWLGLLSYLAIFIAAGWLLMRSFLGCHPDPASSVIPAQSLSSTRSGTGIQANQKNSGSRITRLAEDGESRRECGMTENEKGRFLFSVIFLSLLTAYLVQNLFIFDSFVSYLMLFFILALINNACHPDPAMAGEGSSRGTKLNSRHLNLFVSCLLCLVSFLLLFVIYSYNLKPFLAANYANQILSLPASEAAQITPLLKNALALNSFASPEITYQTTLDYIDKINQNPALAQNEEFYNTVAEVLLKTIERSPSQSRNYIALSWLNLYFSSQNKTRIEQSLQLAQKVRELSPNKKDAYLLLVASYALSNQPQKALEVVDQALAIDAKIGEEVKAYLERLK